MSDAFPRPPAEVSTEPITIDNYYVRAIMAESPNAKLMPVKTYLAEILNVDLEDKKIEHMLANSWLPAFGDNIIVSNDGKIMLMHLRSTGLSHEGMNILFTKYGDVFQLLRNNGVHYSVAGAYLGGGYSIPRSLTASMSVIGADTTIAYTTNKYLNIIGTVLSKTTRTVQIVGNDQEFIKHVIAAINRPIEAL